MLSQNAAAHFFLRIFFCALSFAHIAPHAFAADCPPVEMGEEGIRKAEALSEKVLDYLQNTDAKVALVGRAGSDAPEKRFAEKIGPLNSWNYTHGGLAYRDHPDGGGDGGGEWTFVHLLNTCAEESEVFVQSVVEFFSDNPYEYRAVVAIPSAPMQNALEDLVVRQNAGNDYRGGSVYSSISYPFSLARQNSNEYVLDTLAAALAKMEDRVILSRAEAKEYFLSSAHRDKFAPEILRAGFWETLGASFGLGPDNATLDDHTPAERAAGKFEFVSVGSLIQFLDELGMLLDAEELALPDISRAKDTTILAE